MITLDALGMQDGVRHGFFTREGGVSGGIYAALNCGWGSGDSIDHVTENRRRAMARLDLDGEALATLHQVHSPTVVAVEAASPFGWHEFADDVVGLTRFGASAPAPTLYEQLGITAEAVAARVMDLLGKE